MAPPPDPCLDVPASAAALLVQMGDEAQVHHQSALRLGRLLLAAERVALESRDRWTVFGVTSLGQLCERVLNTPAAAGHQMRAAAWACERSADLRVRLQAGRLSVAKAAAIARVLDYVRETGEEQALLDLAEHGTTQDTRTEVARLREQMRAPRRLVLVSVFLGEQGVTHLRRTQDLLTDGRGGPRATPSQAVEAALEMFVERRCPERKAARARRRQETKRAEDADHDGAPPRDGDACPQSPAGAGRAHSRYTPAADLHRLIEMHGDRCWVEGCEERGALQVAHLRPLRLGGASRWWNEARWCLAHHRLIDGDVLKLRESGEDVILVDRRGQVVGKLRARPPPEK